MSTGDFVSWRKPFGEARQGSPPTPVLLCLFRVQKPLFQHPSSCSPGSHWLCGSFLPLCAEGGTLLFQVRKEEWRAGPC